MSDWHIYLAVRALEAGGLVLHATEGVWGLACDPFNREAVASLLALKGRPVSKGLIVIGADAETFSPELDALDARARHAVLETWPGAVTWILPTQRFPAWITGGRDHVAARVPGHPQARALARAFAGPLVSTSANPSGRPPARRALQARRQFRGADAPTERRFPGPRDYVLPGEVLSPGAPSQIRTLTGQVLRP
ncbi:MAG: L-threonylcarbamoyladenylate synthase [Pseudomonadales bacterium]